jgi:hypothetical protein
MWVYLEGVGTKTMDTTEFLPGFPDVSVGRTTSRLSVLSSNLLQYSGYILSRSFTRQIIESLFAFFHTASSN